MGSESFAPQGGGCVWGIGDEQFFKVWLVIEKVMKMQTSGDTFYGFDDPGGGWKSEVCFGGFFGKNFHYPNSSGFLMPFPKIYRLRCFSFMPLINMRFRRGLLFTLPHIRFSRPIVYMYILIKRL